MSERALIIRGGAVIDGGEYEAPIKVYGSLKVNGDIKARSLECYGSIMIDGEAKIDEFMIVKGSIIANDIRIRGDLELSGGAKITGDINCGGKIKAMGGIQITGDIDCSDLEINGGIKVQGDLSTVGNCKIKGGVKIDGDITAGENIIILLSGSGISIVNGSMKAGESIIVRREKGELKMVIKDDLEAGNKIELEYSEVEGDVKAENVQLGKEVIIYGDVYYKNEIEMNEEVKIEGELVKIKST